MAQRVAVFLVLLRVLAFAHSFEETRVEDPTTDFYVNLLKRLLANTATTIQGALTKIEKESAKEAKQTELSESLKDVENSVGNLEKKIKDISRSVDDGVDRTRVEVRMFRDRMSKDLEDLRNVVKDGNEKLNRQMAQLVAADCQDLYQLGHNASGLYHLARHGRDVLCEMENSSSGWLVIQRRARVTNQVNFDRVWDDYKKGFGDVETEFWIGNDFLHVLTNQKTYQLRIDIHDYEKGAFWASYSTFRVGNEGSRYALYVGDFTGNTTDAFTYHHGRSFSTKDSDSDLYTSGNCAQEFTGGWWYDRCYDAHLNGLFPVVPDRRNASFLTWWVDHGGRRVPYVLDKVTMKIKPRSL